MKLSRKAKKRLLIVGVLLSPLVILLIAYLCNIGEPTEYRILRERIKQSEVANTKPFPLTNPPVSSIASDATTATVTKQLAASRDNTSLTNPLIYTLHNIDPQKGIKYHHASNFSWHGPMNPSTVKERKKMIWQEIQWDTEYQLSKRKPIGDKQSFHALLDQVTEYFLDPEMDIKTFGQPFSMQKSRLDLFTLLYYSCFREILRGNNAKAIKLHQLFTDFIFEGLNTGSLSRNDGLIYQRENELLLYFNLTWAMLEKQVFSEMEKNQFKKRYINSYHQDPYFNQPADFHERRAKYIMKQVDDLCDQLDHSTNSLKVECSLNFFLEDTLGGVLHPVWYGTVNPLIKHQLKKYALALINNDLEEIKKQRANFWKYDGFLKISDRLGKREEALYDKDISYYLPKEIAQDFPCLTLNYLLKSYALSMVSLVEVTDIYHQHGAYPFGEYTPDFTSDKFSKQNKFYVLPLGGMDSSFSFASFLDKDKRNQLDVGPRIYLSFGVTKSCVEEKINGNGMRYKAISGIGPLRKMMRSSRLYEKTKQKGVIPATSYQWTFRFWDESEEALDELLIKNDKY
jgi:hypothetical protein